MNHWSTKISRIKTKRKKGIARFSYGPIRNIFVLVISLLSQNWTKIQTCPYAVTSIKQSPVFKGHLFLVLSENCIWI
jgi:hypothetical protein